MKLKQRIGDFRVRELLTEGYLREVGEHRVYRVTKRKLTTPEAVKALAAELGVDVGDVAVAGLKDRQGITTQFMSVPRGRKVRLQESELKVDAVGFADEPLRSEFSRGNAFEITARALRGRDLHRLRSSLQVVRDHGLVNYFDDQRFGNLTHGQGWIVRDLMQGDAEGALKSLIAKPGPHDNDHFTRFKHGLTRCWGDWRACRDVAGKFGQHHSVFEHLAKNPDDFAGAFYYISARLRLIHLYAFQSHLWNRAVVELVRSLVAVEERIPLDSEEGVLVTYAQAPPPELVAAGTFPLAGEGLDGVDVPEYLAIYEDVLAQERLVPDQYRVVGVSGFRLKPEARRLLLRPVHLRVRPPEEDSLNPGSSLVRIRFELPRGAYATLLVKRLLASGVHGEPSPTGRRHQHTEGRGGRSGTRPGGFASGPQGKRGGRQDSHRAQGQPFKKRAEGEQQEHRQGSRRGSRFQGQRTEGDDRPRGARQSQQQWRGERGSEGSQRSRGSHGYRGPGGSSGNREDKGRRGGQRSAWKGNRGRKPDDVRRPQDKAPQARHSQSMSSDEEPQTGVEE